MKSFGRALRLAFAYRWTFAGSVFCALMIAALWGGNIGTIYPIAEVTFQRKSLHGWVDDNVARCQAEIAKFDQQVAALDARRAAAAADDAAEIDWERANLAEERKRVVASRGWYEWFADHVVRPYLPDDPFQTLLIVIVVLFVGTLIKSLFMVWNAILVSRLALLATMGLRKQFYRRTLAMDLARFNSDGTSDLMNRFTSDVESLGAGMMELLGKLVREPLKMLVCLVAAACISWRLLIFSLLVAPLAVLSIRWLARSLKRANRKAMEEMSEMYGILEESFQGIKVVKAFTMERCERRRFHQSSKQYFHKFMRIARYDALSRPLIEMLGVTIIGMALLAGAYLSVSGKTHILGIRMTHAPMSLGMLTLFYGMLAGLADPARKLSEVFSRIQRGAAAADRIYQLLDREPTIVDPPRPVPLPRHRVALAFENVNFHYQPAQPVLENIDLHIPFGKTIAVVGPNGCGKSTLANLVPRFFDPIGGRVLLDGIDVRDVRLRDLRAQIGIVTQETLLFDDTVFNNIRYGSAQATREEVLEAAERAHAHRFIVERLEHGYETIVGSRGALLSGGQRQRIALARAILRDPAVLILDEATSQVDLESEQLIHRVLEQFMRDRTAIVITHRMSTLALADRIVVMNHGRIEDLGTHDELIRRCGLYSRLYDIQFKEIA